MIRVLPLRAILPLAYMLGLFVLSSFPQWRLQVFGLSARLWDLGHVPLFAGLAWVTLWAILGPAGLRALCVGAVCLAFALTDEVHQIFVPGRVFSWADILADGVGTGLGLALGLWTCPGVAPGKGRTAA